MKNDEIKERIEELLMIMFPEIGTDVNMLLNLNLIDDLGMESITFITLVIELENMFGITVPAEIMEMENFMDFNSIVNVVDKIINFN